MFPDASGSAHGVCLLHMQLTYQKFDLPLKHVFTISRGSVTVQETLVVQLAADGKYGYGEATTNSFYGATIPNMTSAIESVRSVVEEGSLDDPLQLIDRISRKLPKEQYAKFALNAIDQAIHDLWGKLRGRPCTNVGADDRQDSDVGLHARHRHAGEDGRQDEGDAGLAGVQDQAGHGRRPGDRSRAAKAHGCTVSRRRQLRLDGRADDRIRAGAEEAERRVHRAAAAAGGYGGGAAGVRGIGACR